MKYILNQMSDQAQNLVLFTQGFPFEKGEIFLHKEVEYLAQKFDKILIIPYYAHGEAIPLPKNISVKVLPDIWEVPAKFWKESVKKHRFSILKFYFAEWVSQFRNPKVWKLARENFALVKYFFVLVEWMDSIVSEFGKEKTIYYSYWCSDRATVLGILKFSGKIDIAISRVHGFDLYAEQNSYIRFRSFQVRSLNSILPISYNGAEYLKKIFPVNADKFITFRLGVSDNGLNPLISDNPFTIVSCSAVSSHKRVKEIATAICGLSSEARWIHFGDGPELDEVKEIVSGAPPFIKVDLPGNVPNNSILDFYKTNSVHVFINFSNVEGIPFSIMEAISFGIPILGVDIGAVAEIVTPETGILLSEKSTIIDLIKTIDQFRDNSRFGPLFRLSVKKFWKENFDGEINHSKFIQYLKQL